MELVTTAIIPPSDLTTPFRLIWAISRHFLPVLQADPPMWLTTGLTKGSRLPVMAYFFSFSCAGLSPIGPWACTTGFDWAFVPFFAGLGTMTITGFPAT